MPTTLAHWARTGRVEWSPGAPVPPCDQDGGLCYHHRPNSGSRVPPEHFGHGSFPVGPHVSHGSISSEKPAQSGHQIFFVPVHVPHMSPGFI